MKKHTTGAAGFEPATSSYDTNDVAPDSSISPLRVQEKGAEEGGADGAEPPPTRNEPVIRGSASNQRRALTPLRHFSGPRQRVEVIDLSSPLAGRRGFVRRILESGYARIRMDEALPAGVDCASDRRNLSSNDPRQRDVNLYPQRCAAVLGGAE